MPNSPATLHQDANIEIRVAGCGQRYGKPERQQTPEPVMQVLGAQVQGRRDARRQRAPRVTGLPPRGCSTNSAAMSSVKKHTKGFPSHVSGQLHVSVRECRLAKKHPTPEIADDETCKYHDRTCRVSATISQHPRTGWTSYPSC